MRLQRLIIPVLFALLLVIAYVVAAQTDENLPEPYRAVSLNVMEPGALAAQAAEMDTLPAASAVCEAP